MNYTISTSLFEDINRDDKATAFWEILIMLTIAFLLGMIIHWLWCKVFHSKHNVVAKSAPKAAAPVMAAKSVSAPKKKVATKPAAKKKPANRPKVRKNDDLTMIEGIGPKIKRLLNAADIRSFEDLAGSNKTAIKKVLDAAGPRFQMHDPGTWPKQAALAAAGKMDELQKLQDRLNGGK